MLPVSWKRQPDSDHIMKLSRIISWFVLLALAASCVTQPPTTTTTPRIDGQFNDWPTSALIATDPQGDATGAFDITRVSAMSRDSTLYLRFDTGRVLNLQNGPEADGTLQVHLGMAEGQSLTLDLRGRKAWGKQEKKFPISLLPFVCRPTTLRPPGRSRSSNAVLACPPSVSSSHHAYPFHRTTGTTVDVNGAVSRGPAVLFSNRNVLMGDSVCNRCATIPCFIRPFMPYFATSGSHLSTGIGRC